MPDQHVTLPWHPAELAKLADIPVVYELRPDEPPPRAARFHLPGGAVMSAAGFRRAGGVLPRAWRFGRPTHAKPRP